MKVTKLACVSLVASLVVVFAGCETRRCGAVARVDDAGPGIATRYRYRLVRSAETEAWSKQMAKLGVGGGLAETIAFPGFCREDILNDSPYTNEVLRQEFPQVFSDDGIEFRIHRSDLRRESKYSWTMLPYICSIALFPCLTHDETTLAYDVEIPDAEKGKSSFEVMYFSEGAQSIWPTAFLAFGDEPDVGGGRLFCKSEKIAGLNEGVNHLAGQFCTHLELIGFRKKAFAYAVVKRLKELEDSGVIDEMLRKRETARAKAPPHRIERLSRDPNKDFAYAFALKLEDAPANPKEVVRDVIHDFAKALVDDYVDTFPNAQKDSLRVAFWGVAVDGVKISGRAAVLTIAPLSLTYDATARRGKLSVRYNPGQAAESKKWILENIVALARDKNILLTTGTMPPPGKYSICSEKTENNTLEIEFKTE